MEAKRSRGLGLITCGDCLTRQGAPMIIEDMTMPEFQVGLEKTRSVLIPFGSTEQHGSHLPLSTDTLQAVEVGKKLSQRRPLFVAPYVPYGVCRSTAQHSGTLSISTSTLRALAIDIVRALHGNGLRNFILLTGHSGGTHTATLLDSGEELLHLFPDSNVAVLTEYMLAENAGRALVETKGDSHAGEIETSRILHSHPQLVKGRGVAEFPDFPNGILVRDKRKYWPGGVWGNPSCATAEKGRQIEALVIDALEEVVDAMEQQLF